MKPIALLWTAAGARSRRAMVWGALLAASAEVAAAALLGVSGWFLTSCALVTAQANTTWSWMYPSGTVRSLALGRTGLRYTERLTSHRALLDATVALRVRMFRAAAALPARQLRNWRDGALLTTLTDDVATVGAAPARILAPLAGILATAAVVVALISIASPVAGAGQAVLFVVAGGIAVRTNSRAAALHARARSARSLARSALISDHASLPELMCLDMVGRARDQILQTVSRAEGFDTDCLAAVRRGRLLLRLLGSIGQASILVLALSTHSAIQPVASAIGETLLVAAAYELVESLPHILRDSDSAGACAARLTTFLTPTRPVTAPTPGPAVSASAPLVVQGLPVGSGVEQARWSAVLASGTVTLICGPNGSGKTTLLNILAGRIAPPHPGTVLLDGSAPRDLPAGAVAQRLTLVEAEDWLADTTIADNLRQADPDADDVTLLAALDAAALDKLPLDTATGVMGSALSQGQRRRLGVARAILRNPSILLLDEPVLGLDPATAVRLMNGVRRALPGCVLVIALHDQHRELVPFPAEGLLRLR
ncbi:ATP-binding cassette subfamily C protein CydC [Nocardia sp. GAS34]|uniref:ATP-binding cassette domain-containing protein n=1 Tax=unclassified Nocardia TaxID=2637762 RepID=UPI003D25A5E1